MTAGTRAVLAAALVLGTAACGGQGPDTSAGDGAASASATATAPEGVTATATPAATVSAGDPDRATVAPIDPSALSGAHQTTAAAPTSACSLLRADEVAAALGASVADGAPTAPGTCSWSGGPDAATVDLVALVFDDPDACAAVRPPDAEPLAGRGDVAWWEAVELDVAVGTLTVCRGTYQLTVTLRGGPQPPDRATAEALADLALGRL